MSLYEWGVKANHETQTIEISNHFAELFVEKTRSNFHKFNDEKEL